MFLISPDLEPDDAIEVPENHYQEGEGSDSGKYRDLIDCLNWAFDNNEFDITKEIGEALEMFSQNEDYLRKGVNPSVFMHPTFGRIYIFKCDDNGNTYRYCANIDAMGILTGY